MGYVENGDNIIHKIDFVSEDKKPEGLTKPLFPLNLPLDVKKSLKEGSSDIIRLIKSNEPPDILVNVGKSGDLAFSAVTKVSEKEGLTENRVVLENIGEIAWLYEGLNGKLSDFNPEFEEWAINNAVTVQTVLHTKELMEPFIDFNKKDNFRVTVVKDWPDNEEELLIVTYYVLKLSLREIERKNSIKNRVSSRAANVVYVDFVPKIRGDSKIKLDYLNLINTNWLYRVSEKIAKDLRISPKKISSYYLTEYLYGILLGVDNLEFLGHKIVDEAKLSKEKRTIKNPTYLLEEKYGREELMSLREKLKKKIEEIADDL